MYSYAIPISPQLLHQLLTYFVNTHCCQTNYSAAFLHWTVSVKCTKYSLQKACFLVYFYHCGERERLCIASDEVHNSGMKWGEIKVQLMHLNVTTYSSVHTHTHTHTHAHIH